MIFIEVLRSLALKFLRQRRSTNGQIQALKAAARSVLRTNCQPRSHRSPCPWLPWAITGQQSEQETQRPLVSHQPPPPPSRSKFEAEIGKMTHLRCQASHLLLPQPSESSPGDCELLAPQLVPFCSLADTHPLPRSACPLGSQRH